MKAQIPFETFVKNLEEKIENAYIEGVSMESAERLAGEFLGAQLRVSEKLAALDLDSRMRKSGVKAIRAAVYAEAKSGEAKLTEAAVAAIIDTDEMVGKEQDGLDSAEVERDELKRIYDIFGNAHIFFRNVSKGSFGG